MIGLGSNRLTVCRRGGMSVTQAGRGGMEWLAGGRVPDWITPYSAQATAALKAAFTAAQWATIRDYGFAHPALVPFINEDPMLVMSLIEGLGTRWLVGDGTAIIDTGFYPNQSTHAKCKANFHFGLDNPAVFGCRTNYTSQNVEAYYIADTGSADLFNLGFGNQIVAATSTAQDPAFKGVHVFEVENKVFKLDGVAKATSTAASFTSTKTFCFPGYNDGYSNRGYMPAALPIAFCDYNDSRFKPFITGKARTSDECYPHKACGIGEKGMINLETGLFHPNANSSGSFTISETPAS